MAQANTTSPAHTPAPWCFMDDLLLGKTQNNYSNTIVVACFSELPNQANAKLIAAAPELLEDLKALCVLTAEVIEAAHGKISDCPHLVKAMETIAKAKGRA